VSPVGVQPSLICPEKLKFIPEPKFKFVRGLTEIDYSICAKKGFYRPGTRMTAGKNYCGKTDYNYGDCHYSFF
jgi:hypothetical protein